MEDTVLIHATTLRLGLERLRVGEPHVTAWYDVAFDDLYAEIYAHRDDVEAETAIGWLARALPAVGLGELRGRRVLDLACGAGRHLRALAMPRRAEPIGIDRSTALLARARVRVAPGGGAGGRRSCGPCRLPIAPSGCDQHVHEPRLLRRRERSCRRPSRRRRGSSTAGGFLLIDYLNAQAVIADPGRDTSRSDR